MVWLLRCFKIFGNKFEWRIEELNMIYLRGIINVEEEGNKINKLNIMVKFISYDFIKYLYNRYILKTTLMNGLFIKISK